MRQHNEEAIKEVLMDELEARYRDMVIEELRKRKKMHVVGGNTFDNEGWYQNVHYTFNDLINKLMTQCYENAVDTACNLIEDYQHREG